jgi:pimeloyl-ACP methyl ester carboxylesterase
MANRVIADAIARATSIVDRGALRLMERSMRRNGPRRTPEDARRRLLSLGERYGTAANLAADSAFFEAPSVPDFYERDTERRLGKTRVIDLSFESTYRPFLPDYREEHARYAENLTVHARWFRHPPNGAPRPVAVCIHGWGGGSYWLEERAFVVPYLVRMGMDVVLVQLPFHGERAPRQAPRSGALFPSAHVVRTNEAFGQAIHDLRALAARLRARGAPSIGVMGMSLGGYTTALWASLDDSLAFAIPIIPAVSMSDLMWRHGRETPARRRAERLGISQDLLDAVFEVHSPLTRPARLEARRLLIVAGEGDRITPPDQARALWRHWGEPAQHWFPGGHLAQVGRGDAFRRIRQHITPLLEQ